RSALPAVRSRRAGYRGPTWIGAAVRGAAWSAGEAGAGGRVVVQGVGDPLSGGVGERVGQRLGGEPADLEGLLIPHRRLATGVPAPERQVQVLGAVAVRVTHLLAGEHADQRLYLGVHTGLLEDLAQQRGCRLLSRFQDAADHRPPAGVGAATEQDAALGIEHHGTDPGEPEQVGADVAAQGGDELGDGHPTIVTERCATPSTRRGRAAQWPAGPGPAGPGPAEISGGAGGSPCPPAPPALSAPGS